jgi:ferritin-like metal-binding protein YciE
MKIQSVEELFHQGLQYVYDAEQQLSEALPKMAAASSSPELRQAFEKHAAETRQQVNRAMEIFKSIGKQPETKPNAVVKQMVQEAEQMIQNTDQNPVRDAALIVAGNQVEHYEIASYGSLKTYAQLLDNQQALRVIEQTLGEEKQADQLLTQIGEQSVNQKALQQASKATA